MECELTVIEQAKIFACSFPVRRLSPETREGALARALT